MSVCLNLSSPVIKQAINKIGSEPTVLDIVIELGEDASLQAILDRYEEKKSAYEGVTPKLKTLVKTFYDRIDASYDRLQNIVVNGRQFDSAAIVKATRDVLGYVDGLSNNISEEAVSLVVEVIEELDPVLFNTMLKNINKYEEYNLVMNELASNPVYRTADNKPDIRKLKKKAIIDKMAKVFVDGLQEDSQKNNMFFWEWMDKVKQFFKDAVQTAGFNPFNQEEAQPKVESTTATEFISEDVPDPLAKRPTPPSTIKPGVEELFQTNPELANAVYEALGFVPKMITREGQEYFNNPRIRFFVKIADEVRASLPKIEDGYTRLYRGNRPSDLKSNPQFTNSLEGIALPFLMSYEGQLSYIDIPTSDLSKYVQKGGVATNAEFIVTPEIAKTATPIDNTIVEKYKEQYPDKFAPVEITPQQKQEAQQLYSQYLDTIFPDSKVKDIVYHGTNNPNFSGFDSDFSRAIHFGTLQAAKDRRLHTDFEFKNNAKFIPALLNIKSPLKSEQDFNFESDDLEFEDSPDFDFTKEQGYRLLITYLHNKGYNVYHPQGGVYRDGEILNNAGLDSVIYKNEREDKGNYSFAVFEPEQIHILGNKQDIEGFKEFVQGEKEVPSQMLYQIRDKEELGPQIEELDKYLLDFLKPFGVKSKQFEELKSRLNVDALGATDVLNKLIWYTKNRNQETVPEEVGHMIVMLMGEDSPVIKQLLTEIENWSEYKAVKDVYMPVYQNEKKVRVEAIGKLLAKSLVKNYKASGLNPSLLKRALDAIERLLQSIVEIFSTYNYSEKLTDKIAINILLGNKDFIAQLKPSAEKLDYGRAIEKNPHAKNIIEVFGNKLNNPLVGSLAIAGQGEDIYRPSENPIHDLDFIVDGTKPGKLKELEDALTSYNAVNVHYGWSNPNKSYTTYAYFIPKKGYQVEVLRRDGNGWAKILVVKDENGNYVTPNASNVIGVDFFVYSTPLKQRIVDDFSSWNDIYYGKLSLSKLGSKEVLFQRKKDQLDYVFLDPKNRNFISNPLFVYYQMSPEEAAQTAQLEEEGPIGRMDAENMFFQLSQQVPENFKQEQLIQKLRSSPVKKSKEGYTVMGVAVPTRVTTIVDKMAAILFRKNRLIDKSEYQQIVDEIKRETGDASHLDMQHAASLFIDETGARRATPKDDKDYVPQTSPRLYKDMVRYMERRINSFPEGTKFLTEIPIYDPKGYQGRGLAGTIDFIAITKEGKVSILDWKFTDINLDYNQDVPWYKKKTYREQMRLYQKILVDAYGVKMKDFVKTEVVPIKAHYVYFKGSDGKKYPKLDKLEFGKINSQREENDYLLPVTLETQSTGDEVIDGLVAKLYGLQRSLEAGSAKTAEERFRKATQLEYIEKAIRHLQVKLAVEPLIDQADVFTQEIEALFDYFENVLPEADLSTQDGKVAYNNFGLRLDKAFDQIKIYTDLNEELETVFKGELTDKQKRILEKLNKAVTKARSYKRKLVNVANEFGEALAENVSMEDLTDPQKKIGLFDRLWTSTSKLQSKSLGVLYKYRREAQNRMDFKTNEENKELQDIQKSFAELAKKKGAKVVDLLNLVRDKATNELIGQFDKKYREEVKHAIEQKDAKWIIKNVDIDLYEQKLLEKKKRKEEYLKTKVYSGNKSEVAKRRKKDIEDLEKEFDIETFEGDGWYRHFYLMANSPKEELWTSKEWETLNSKDNEITVDGKTVNPARELYDWVVKINAKAEDIGYLPETYGQGAFSFLPFVQKKFAEKFQFGGKVEVLDRLLQDITIDEATVNIGETDPISNRLVRRIPKPFLVPRRVVDGEVITPDPETVSDDLFKNLALYNIAVNKYQELSNIEGVALALGRLEENKKSIQTTSFGNPKLKENGEPVVLDTNESNKNLFDNQVATLIYDQKYIDTESFDILLGNPNVFFEKANKFLGRDIFPTDLPDSQISVNRLIETTNRVFQKLKIGANPLVALSNALGGTANAIIASNKYMSEKDFLVSQWEISTNGFRGDEGNKFKAAVEYFLPLTDDVNSDLAREMTMLNFSGDQLQDLLFFFMRKGDRFVQSSLFLGNLKNHIVMDGEVVSVKDYVKTLPEFKNKYDAPEGIEAVEAKMKEKEEELKEKYGVLTVATVENGKLVIPGVSRDSEGVQKVRNLTRELSKMVLGNSTPEEVRGYQQNIFLRSMMVFKGWIPPLSDARYSGLKYNAAVDSYEWGRTRAFMRYLTFTGLSSLHRLRDIARGTPKGIEILNDMYEYKKEQYKKATGNELKMSEQDFYDMTREAIVNGAKDVVTTLSVVSMYYALAVLLKPDDDEDKQIKNVYKFTVRAFDKISDELAFFYSPNSFQGILNGSLFPSMGIITDAIKLLNSLGKEVWGFYFDEELQEKNYVLKNVFKMFPVISQMGTYLPLFAPELASELGINMSKESRVR